MARNERETIREIRPEPGTVRHRPDEYVSPEDVRARLEQRQAPANELAARAPRSAPLPRRPQLPSLRHNVRRALSSPATLRQAMVLHAVLGPPAALQREDER